MPLLMQLCGAVVIRPLVLVGVGEPEMGDSKEGSHLTGVEVREAVKKLHCGSSPGVDEVQPECLKPWIL